MPSREPTDWQRQLTSYVKTVNSQETDSEYLRRVGLKPIILALCGNASTATVLDVGAADGWLLNALQPQFGISCDVTTPGMSLGQAAFVLGKAEQLPVRSGVIDLITASLVLMWIDDLWQAYAEMRRVTRPGGKLVAAVVHPSFYRTGKTQKDGSFIIERSLNSQWVLSDLKIGGRSGPFNYYYHPYDSYLNTAIACGWRLLTVRDWFIDMNDYHRSVDEDSQHIRRSGNVPLYSFFHFQAD